MSCQQNRVYSYSFICTATAFLLDYCDLETGGKKKKSKAIQTNKKKKRTQKRKLEVLTLISKAIFIQEWGIRPTHSRRIPIFTIFILTPNFISVVHNLEQLSYTLPPFLQLARINSCFTRLLHIINWNKKLLNNNRTTVTAKKPNQTTCWNTIK